jgi:hypothetical protein
MTRQLLKGRSRVILEPGMKVRVLVYVDQEGKTMRKPRVLTVVRVKTAIARVLGSNFPVEQHILILVDGKGLNYEHDLVRPIEVKDKKGKWVKRFGK